MSENQQYDDPLEQFFRKKAGEYNVSYREEDWNKLEKELDLRDLKSAYRTKVRLLAAAALLIISLLGYFTLENHLALNEIRQQISEEINPDAGPGSHQTDEPAPFDESSRVADESDAARERNLSENQHPDENDPGSTPGERFDEQRPVAVDAGSMENEEYNSTGQIASGTDIKDHQPDGAILSDHQPDDMLPHGIARIGSESSLYVTAVPQVNLYDHAEFRILETAILTMHPSGLPTDQSAAFVSSVEKDATHEETGTSGIEMRPLSASGTTSGTSAWNSLSRFSAGLVYSPDLSSAGSFGNFGKPGHKIGFTIDYQLSRNLYVSSGIIHSLVKYDAPGGAYNLPSYYNGGSQPNDIAGECSLLDIPVALRYHFLNFSRSGFYVSTGLSSYIMLKEEYAFSTYQNGYRQDQIFSERTGTRHWLSNASFSFGYEMELTGNISLRAEPFVRIPVSRVGWADVSLYSVGSFISVSYQL